MTPLRAELEAKWREAGLVGRAGHEWRGVGLSVSAPLRLTAAVREPDDRIALLLEAPLEMAPASRCRLQAEGVSLEDQRRPEENIFRLAVTLEHQELRDVFVVLAADIVETVQAATSPAGAIVQAMRRLETWQACLRMRRQLMSKAEQVGLMGELCTLRLIASEIGYGRAVDVWEGPLDGIHDFTGAGTAIEVKSALGAGNLLRISHLDQLDSTGLSYLAIARLQFREEVSGELLPDMIGQIRDEIARTAVAARAIFDERLLRAGHVDLGAEADDAPRVVLQDLYGFEIRDDFPRLTTRSVPTGIVDASYSIDGRAITPWRINDECIRTLARSMAGGAG